MKKFLLLALLLNSLISLAQAKYLLPNEEIVYTFSTKKGKVMMLAKDRQNKYLVYRFGSKEKIELEFPEKKNKESWKKFKYSYYMRGGGKANAGRENDHVYFYNNGFRYTLYRDYDAGDDKNPESFVEGIVITRLKDDKQISKIIAVESSVKGGFYDLRSDGLIEEGEDLD